jgi:hypothetical protein
MKNKLFLLGILAIALVFGMTVVGCDNGAQTVAFERAEAVEWVFVEINSNRVSVAWGRTENGIKYDIYVQVEDESGTHAHHLDSYTGVGNNLSLDINSNSNKSRMRFGVTATDFDENHVASKIVWSEYFMLPYDFFYYR